MGKPQFPQVEQAHAKDIITLGEVRVSYMFELSEGVTQKGAPWSRQDLKIENNEYETKLKDWRRTVPLNVGDIITVCGEIEEYQGNKSLSIQRKGPTGIALDGEPLAVVPAAAGVARPPALQPIPTREVKAPTPVQGNGKHTISEHREAKVVAFKWYFEHIADYEKDDTAVLAAKVKVAGAFSSGESISEARNEIIPDLPF